MKKSMVPSALLCSTLICFVVLQSSFGQNDGLAAGFSAAQTLLPVSPAHVQKIVDKPEQKPDFRAGQHTASFDGLAGYAAANLVYPDEARENAVEGTVNVLVEISSNGEVAKAAITDSPGYGCGEAVPEMLRHMPGWQPAMTYGIPVKSKVKLEFNFVFLPGVN